MKWKLYAENNKELNWSGRLEQSNLPRTSAISFKIRAYEENKQAIKKAKGEQAEKAYIAQMSVYELIEIGIYDDKEKTIRTYPHPDVIFDYEKYEKDLKERKELKQCQEQDEECQDTQAE